MAFAVLFGISGILHAYQCLYVVPRSRCTRLYLLSFVSKYKCWKVGGLLPWAAALFVGAFITRAIGAYNYDDLGIFIASTVMFLVAACVFSTVSSPHAHC